MSTNKKISTVVPRQLPEFVKAEHPTFIAFLQAYYEYLEQSNSTVSMGKTVERAKNLTNYFDVDKINETGLTEFNERLFKQFMSSIPEEAVADRTKIIKHIKDFYRAGGTEKSYNFLFRILFGEEGEYYYPKNDILFASSGKWLIEKSVRLRNTKYNGVANSSIDILKKFQSTFIKGNTSLASAKVERVQFGYERELLYNEFILSGLEGNFELDEEIFIVNTDGDVLTGNVLSGYVTSITIANGGTGYVEGTGVPLISSTGNGAVATISSVSKGNVATVFVTKGGSGFRAGDYVFFADPPGFTGTRSNAIVLSVNKDGSVHPNTYILCANIISEQTNTVIGAYSNGSSGDANTPVSNTLTYYSFANTGPVSTISVLNPGEGYITIPVANVIGNSVIRSLGIIGSIKINSSGSGYANGDIVQFRNVIGGYGSGANAVVVVNSSGSIVDVELKAIVPNQIIGGTGYRQNFYPQLEIITSGGVNGSLEVESLLGFGDILSPTTGSVGEILNIRVDAPGIRYESAPIVDLSNLGDGNANAYANIATGILTSPGRFTDDTGKLSSSSFLQDRDYYQRFSYVTKINKALTEYKKHLLELVHPAGTKLWAEYLYKKPDVNVNMRVSNADIVLLSTFRANSIEYNANSVIYKTTSLRRIANTTNGTISLWFNPTNLSNDQIIFAISDKKDLSNSPKFEITVTGSSNSNNLIRITGRNSQNTILLHMTSNARNKIAGNTWNSLLATWDLSNVANCRIYLNEINSTNVYPNWTYTGNSYNTSSVDRFATGIFFRPDGRRMFVSTSSNNKIIQYNLSNSWNIQSATFFANTANDDNKTLSTFEDLYWRSDGKRLYTLVRKDLLSNIAVVKGGTGYRVGDYINFVNPVDFTGVTANAQVVSVLDDGSVHPSSYLLCANVISEEETTIIGAYSNGVSGDANTPLSNTLTYYTYSSTGPVLGISVLSSGSGYVSLPTANVIGNSAIKNLGTIGRIKVVSSGSGYANGDILTFRNVIGGYGSGANAVLVVNGSGSILRAELKEITPNYIIGGTGYKYGYFPTIEITTSGGVGGSLVVEDLLANGDVLSIASGSEGIAVIEYQVSDAWNVQTVNVFSNTFSFNVASQDNKPNGLFFSNNGTKLFIVGEENRKVYSYNLSKPWSINTASYSSNISISNIENLPVSIYFSNSGTQMYVLGSSIPAAHEFYLNSAWDLASTIYNRSFDLGDDMDNPRGLYMDHSNGRAFIAGSNTAALSWESVREYTALKSNTLINNRNTTGQYNLIYYKGSNVTVSGTAGQNNKFLGCLAEVWFTPNHVNLANSSIRNRFFNNFIPGSAALPTDLSVVSSIEIEDSGAGFRSGDYVQIFDPLGFTGRQANVQVISVNSDGSVHPNSYFLCVNTISEQTNTAIGAYSNGSSGDANTSLGNTLIFFAYADTGPVTELEIIDRGQNYNSVPKANVIGNTAIKNLGIIGKIRINSQGIGYANGEIVKFRNVIGGYGSGANAVVVVNAAGSIVDVDLKSYTTGQITGGTGYREGYFPQLEIQTSGGIGANVEVQALLGNGDILSVLTNDFSFGTGFQPIVYMRSNVESANVNSGTGGDFNFANNLIVCDSSPSDI
jgi:hypothetical protein